MKSEKSSILVVDDSDIVREPLIGLLEVQGHGVTEARNGREALKLAQEQAFDLILLDIMMPEMDGYETLQRFKENPDTRHIPVVMLTALNDLESIVRCVKLGAEDYLFKPFDRVLLRARVDASLEKKRWRDQEQAYLKQIEAEQEKSERLLHNILPGPIVTRLKQGEEIIADNFAEVTILFADIVDFTQIAAGLTAAEVITLLNGIFTTFDQLAEQFDLEKIKTIGDAYMVVGGLPLPNADHAQIMADMGLAMQAQVEALAPVNGRSLQMRIGINSGPVVAGVLGIKKFSYDLWGDTVNVAHRMQSQGVPGEIQVSKATYELLQGKYRFEPRGSIPIKGKGNCPTYLLKERLTHE